jgi:L-alanine-DL-glutamate epimerase-like enolase superfamily enzyme
LASSLEHGEDPFDLETRIRTARHRGAAVDCSREASLLLSLVDIAAWDLAARVAGRSLREHLGGMVASLPVLGIGGYPPSLDPDDVTPQVERLRAAGFDHVKLPIVGDLDVDLARIRAASRPAITVSLDGGWTLDSVASALALTAGMEAPGWLEDPVAPEDIGLLAAVRAAVKVRIAMGDEQAGPGFPDALLRADAVDVVRLDAVCVGGISGLRPIVERIRAARRGISFHVYGHLHGPIAAGLGIRDAVVEWSLPGMVVDPVSEARGLPPVHDGRMTVADDGPGLGALWDPHWVAGHALEDPDGILNW